MHLVYGAASDADIQSFVSFRQACLASFHGGRLARSAGPRSISPGNRSCQNAGAVEERSPGHADGGAGLLGTSPQVIVGRFDSDEEHVPLDMFAGGGGPSAREGLIQQYEIGHLIDLRQEPVGKRTTAASRQLANSATGLSR